VVLICSSATRMAAALWTNNPGCNSMMVLCMILSILCDKHTSILLWEPRIRTLPLLHCPGCPNPTFLGHYHCFTAYTCYISISLYMYIRVNGIWVG
jgi:hypothetical protein